MFDFDKDMKHWYLYMCVCVCAYIIFKTNSLFFRYTDCLFLSAVKVIHLMLRAMSDAYFRKVKKIFLCSFKNVQLLFLHIKLPLNVKWL